MRLPSDGTCVLCLRFPIIFVENFCRSEYNQIMECEVKFKIGQKIVYPLQGVGEIVGIDEQIFKEVLTPYYTIYIPVSDMTVMIPVSNTETLGIRALVDKERAQKTLESIAPPASPSHSDWKERYQGNMDMLKTGDIDDIASVVSTLYYRSKNKPQPLPVMERKQYDSALKLLIDELSLVLETDKEEIKERIFAKLEM